MTLPEPRSLPTGRPRSADRAPKAPAHLKADGKRLWRRVAADVVLEGHHLELLRLACEAIDRAEEARKIVDAEGMTIAGRFGPRPHPAVAIERDSSIRASRLIRELGIDLIDDKTRPPSRWRP